MAVVQINTTCDQLYNNTANKFHYEAPALNSSTTEYCERSWENLTGTVLGDGPYLILHYCETGIKKIMRCFTSNHKTTEYIFNVSNSTGSSTVEPHFENYDNHVYLPWLIRILSVVVAVCLVLFGLWKCYGQRWNVWTRLQRACCKRTVENNGGRTDDVNQVENGNAHPLRPIANGVNHDVVHHDENMNGGVLQEEIRPLKNTVTE